MVDISIEVMHECLIQEVTMDGQEIYVQPLSMSENLTKLAHKIDFLKDESEEKGKPTSEGVKEEDEDEEDKKSVTPIQPSLWPWDSVRNKLRAALTEMNVLQDVLTIAKARHYMIVEPVSQANIEQRGNILLIARKRALNSAAAILLGGFERLRKSQESTSKRSNHDFHYELMRLRQYWRLKKIGKSILGDLSYKSAGSQYYWQNGTFEVCKADDTGNSTAQDAVVSPSSQRGQSNPIRVIIPSELEGVALIQVVISDMTKNSPSSAETITFDSVNLGLCKKLTASVPSDAHYQKKLEAAQNVIFCKEIFTQLAREAVQGKALIPHIVIGNQIISHLFPGIHLSISLCHNTEKTKQDPGSENLPKQAHNHVLEHSIHQLLRETHFRNSYQPMPHPVTSMLGVSKRRRLAGPRGYTRAQLQEISPSNETMLERIVQQSQHLVVWQKTLQLIDEMAVEIHDPQILAHTSITNVPKESIVKIYISFANYDLVRTMFMLHVSVDKIQASCRDGRMIKLSYETQQLRDFILCQVSEHHITSVQTAAKLLGWKILTVTNHIGVGNLEPVGNAQGIMLVSPNNDRILSVRCQPTRPPKVFVRKCPDMGEGHVPIGVQRSKWTGLNELYQEICLSRVSGCNFVQKIETIMACYTPDRSEYSMY